MNKTLIIVAFLFASAFYACDKKDDTIVAADNIIRLEFESDTAQLAANGVSLIRLKATIASNAEEAWRKVIFTVSDAAFGTFQSTATDNKNIVRANDSGIARINFKVGTTPGLYFISAQIKKGDDSRKSTEYAFNLGPVSDTDKISISVDNMNPPADAFTLIKISVKTAAATDKKVILKTNAGIFLGSADPKSTTINVDAAGDGVLAYQVSNDVQPHIISASLTNGAQAQVIITPSISYADTILIEPTALKIDTTGGTIGFKGTLKKFSQGAKVSKNTPIYGSAYQVNTAGHVKVGRFTGLNNAASDADGNISSINFYADTGGIDAMLPIFIDFTFPTSLSTTGNQTTIIRIK